MYVDWYLCLQPDLDNFFILGSLARVEAHMPHYFPLFKCSEVLLEEFAVTGSEFSETPNQAYFYANFWFCTCTFSFWGFLFTPIFFLLTHLKHLKTPEEDRRSSNLASATKDQMISANPMPQGLSYDIQ